MDIGSDTGTPMDDKDYQVTSAFIGKLNKMTLTIDRPKLSPEDIGMLVKVWKEPAAGRSDLLAIPAVKEGVAG